MDQQISKQTLTSIEIKFNKFVKSVINELDLLKKQIKNIQNSKVDKRIIYKYVQNSQEPEKEIIKNLRAKNQISEVEIDHLRSIITKLTNEKEYQKQGYLAEIKILNDALKNMNDAVVE
eukprot:NODE_92_length_21543_cov_0.719036.p18 type:complete len:119 gc:universal NODE_92_length_21543_cov_0.719036:15861-16217(+)